jgi:D-sedoheptulose 7-phosphate isomerase
MTTDRTAFSARYVRELVTALEALPHDAISGALAAFERAYDEGRQVFIAGNGGSAATASHMCNDLVWGMAQIGRAPFRAVALTDCVPLMTAISNDRSYDDIFSVPLRALARPGDLFVVFSGSGNSPNVVRAVEAARELDLATVAFLGRGGGKLAAMVDVPVVVPSDDYGPIEDIHMMFDHLIIRYFRARGAEAR